MKSSSEVQDKKGTEGYKEQEIAGMATEGAAVLDG